MISTKSWPKPSTILLKFNILDSLRLGNMPARHRQIILDTATPIKYRYNVYTIRVFVMCHGRLHLTAAPSFPRRFREHFSRRGAVALEPGMQLNRP